MKYCHQKLRFPALSLLFSSVLLISVAANRICWSNHCIDGQDWCFQTCNITAHELSCLAQYRETLNGEKVPAYFGCYNKLCDELCEPVEKIISDFMCCCSGDLCNEIEDVTPIEDVPTPSPTRNTSPTIDIHDGECGLYIC